MYVEHYYMFSTKKGESQYLVQNPYANKFNEVKRGWWYIERIYRIQENGRRKY